MYQKRLVAELPHADDLEKRTLTPLFWLFGSCWHELAVRPFGMQRY